MAPQERSRTSIDDGGGGIEPRRRPTSEESPENLDVATPDDRAIGVRTTSRDGGARGTAAHPPTCLTMARHGLPEQLALLESWKPSRGQKYRRGEKGAVPCPIGHPVSSLPSRRCWSGVQPRRGRRDRQRAEAIPAGGRSLGSSGRRGRPQKRGRRALLLPYFVSPSCTSPRQAPVSSSRFSISCLNRSRSPRTCLLTTPRRSPATFSAVDSPSTSISTLTRV